MQHKLLILKTLRFISAILYAIFCSFELRAQIQITENETPVINQTYEFYRFTDPAGISAYYTTGSNFVWDFRNLTSGILEQAQFVSPFFTDPLYYIDFTNPLNPPIANLAAAVQDFGFAIPGGTLEDAFEFYYKSNIDYKALGFAAKLNGVPLTARFNQPDLLLKFPLNFSDHWVTNSEFSINIPNTVFFRQRRQRNVTVDGFGTLKLPGLELEVLRVKYLSILNDSIFNFQFGFGTNLPARTETEYLWLAKGFHMPVLRVVNRSTGGFGPGGGQSITDVFYQVGDLSINENIAAEKIELFPNPFENVLNIKLEENFSYTTLTISDISGRIVYQKGLQNSESLLILQDLNLQSGIYFLKLSDHYKSITKKIKVK